MTDGAHGYGAVFFRYDERNGHDACCETDAQSKAADGLVDVEWGCEGGYDHGTEEADADCVDCAADEEGVEGWDAEAGLEEA